MPAIGPRPERIDRSLMALMGVLLVGAWVAQLDTTIVAAAIVDLTRAFDTTVQAAQWVTTVYLLAMAAAIPMMGWLTNWWGARRVWLLTLWLFLAGSILCALAWSIGSLIAFRVVQGLGGGLILPLVQAMVARAAGPRRMGRVRGLDWIGALLMVPATVAILAGLSLIGDLSAGPIVLAAGGAVQLAGGTVLLAGFLLHAWRRGEGALLDLRLLRYRSFSIATVMMFRGVDAAFAHLRLDAGLPRRRLRHRAAPARRTTPSIDRRPDIQK